MSDVIVGRKVTPSLLKRGKDRESREEFPRYQRERSKAYFKYEDNHVEWDVAPNQLRVYCKVPIGVYRYKKIGTMEYHLQEQEICYDYQDSFIARDAEDIPIGIKIVSQRGRLLGVFLPETNILSLCDFTHTPEGTIELLMFLDYLHDQGLLTPVPGGASSGVDNEEEEPIQVTLGSDPEYELIKEGRIVRAKSFSWERTDNVGIDGTGDQIEFRPDPARTPEEFVENLRACYRHVGENLRLNLSTTGNVYPLGAHIHVGAGSPKIMDNNISKLLDLFLGLSLINCSGGARRSYKKLGQCRDKPHGFEYRSLPTAVFHTPEIARAVADVAFTVCKKYYSGEDIRIEGARGATIKDMTSIGIPEKSARLVRTWSRRYKNVAHTSPLTHWLGREFGEIGTRFVHRLEFRDDWRNAVMAQFSNIIQELPCSVLLFGLAESRGAVTFGYQAENYSVCPEPFDGQCSRAELVFGLPYHVRMGACSPRELRLHIDAIKEIIENREVE